MLAMLCGRLFPDDPSLPQRRYQIALPDLKERITAGQYEKKILREWVIGHIVFFLQSVTTARAWFYIFRKVWRIAAEGLDWMLWGFGESPARIFGWVLLSLIGFFGYVKLAKNQNMGTAALCAMSAITGSTCTELADMSGKFMASAYAVVGAILFGLLLAGFFN
jgi:hypothetical protein